MTPLSVIILTFNEEANLPDCLASVQGWAQAVLLVDSGSTDATQQIASRYHANLVEHPFETHARQWEWALANLPIRTQWVMGLDADQRVTPELRDELIGLFTNQQDTLALLDGLYVKRMQIFRGRWIRHGGFYPKYLLKLFRRSRVQFDSLDLVDHHFWIAGKTLNLHGDIVEDNRKERDITFWIGKHARYAVLHAREEMLRRQQLQSVTTAALLGSPDQRVAWLKQRWYHLPLYVRPVIFFLYRYVLRLGFLDGPPGFVFHFLQTFWYRVLVDIHVDDLQRNTTSPS